MRIIGAGLIGRAWATCSPARAGACACGIRDAGAACRRGRLDRATALRTARHGLVDDPARRCERGRDRATRWRKR